jgi:hypothetical protein
MSRIPPVPRLGEMVVNCAHNRDQSDFQRRQLRKQLEGLGPCLEREKLLETLSRVEGDFHHWADYVAHYRRRAASEGERVVPVMGSGALVGAIEKLRERAPEPDRRLPREREIGDDDGDDEALPF